MPHTGRYARIVREKVKEALGIVHVVLPYCFFLRIRTIWIAPTVADIIRRKWATIVEVGLIVGDEYGRRYVTYTRRAAAIPFKLRKVPAKQLKTRCIVVLGSRERQAVGWVAGKNQAKV